MMEFGVTYTADKNFADILWGVKRAEELGFSFVGIPDTPYQSMDVYPYLAACALQTSRIKLGPYITNPLTRHPQYYRQRDGNHSGHVGRTCLSRHGAGE